MSEPSNRRRRHVATIHANRKVAAERSGEAEPESDEGLDLTQLWGTLRDNSRYILRVAAIVTLVVMAYTMHSKMTFKVNGRLYLGDLEVKTRAGSPSGDLDISGVAQGDVGSEIEILKSQSRVTSAILGSGLNVAITPEGWHEPRFWEWLMAGRNPAVLDLPAKELLAANSALVDSSLGSQTYQVTFIAADTYEVRQADVLLGKQRLGAPINLGHAMLTLNAGSERGPVPGSRYTVRIDPLDAMTDAVLGSLVVTAAKGVGVDAAKVVTLEFSSSSPFFATTFLRTLMTGYLGERQAWKTEDASAAESFVTDQLTTLRESLDRSQQRLAEYRSNTRVVVLDNEAKAMIEQVGKYEEQRVSARLQISALLDIKRALKLPNPPTEAFLFGEAEDTVLQGLSKSLSETRQLLDEQISQYGPQSAQARQQQGQVGVQLEMIRNYVTSRLARAQENLNSMNAIIAQFEQKLKTVPGAELGLAQLGRESEVYSRVYSYMLERQQQAAITKASTISKNRILDYPQTPYREDAPKLALRLASAPLGLLLGAILVMLQRLFAASFQSESEIRRLAGDRAVFARVPLRAKPKAGAESAEQSQALDPLGGSLNSPFAEAFRTVRMGLYQSSFSSQGSVVLITSACPGDGKTTTVMGLAAILAADKKRVIVIDADLRKPSHQDITNSPVGPGLRSVLSGQMDWRDVAHRVGLAVGCYDAIGAGKMAPAELLSSERMGRFLEELRAEYDFILLDSPAFPLVADALVLAEVSDSVLSVLRVSHTPRKTAGEHLARLANVASSHGVIINDTTSVGTPYPIVRRESRMELSRVLPLSWSSKLADRRVVIIALLMVGALLAALFTHKREAAQRRELSQGAHFEAAPPPSVATAPQKLSPPAQVGAATEAPVAKPQTSAPNAAEVPSQAAPSSSPEAVAPPARVPAANTAPPPPEPSGADSEAYREWMRMRFPQIVESAQDRATRLRSTPRTARTEEPRASHALPSTSPGEVIPGNPY